MWSHLNIETRNWHHPVKEHNMKPFPKSNCVQPMCSLAQSWSQRVVLHFPGAQPVPQQARGDYRSQLMSPLDCEIVACSHESCPSREPIQPLCLKSSAGMSVQPQKSDSSPAHPHNSTSDGKQCTYPSQDPVSKTACPWTLPHKQSKPLAEMMSEGVSLL